MKTRIRIRIIGEISIPPRFGRKFLIGYRIGAVAL
jgi:hypothetical protein|tara:strand:+ start:453 stop:557 length:105 start_codon:yes stop_codon:yes gene_type:complete